MEYGGVLARLIHGNDQRRLVGASALLSLNSEGPYGIGIRLLSY